MLEKRHVQIITDVLKELASAGIDKLANAYLPVETEKRKRTNRRGKKNRKTNITKDSNSSNIN